LLQNGLPATVEVIVAAIPLKENSIFLHPGYFRFSTNHWHWFALPSHPHATRCFAALLRRLAPATLSHFALILRLKPRKMGNALLRSAPSPTCVGYAVPFCIEIAALPHKMGEHERVRIAHTFAQNGECSEGKGESTHKLRVLPFTYLFEHRCCGFTQIQKDTILFFYITTMY
jgi:hypothetical protein